MTACSCLSYPADNPMARLWLGWPATRYQQQGYAVLPLERGGKRPHRMLGDRGGVHWATLDPAMPEWAWSNDRMANIGIATGQPSGIVVIDLDVKGYDIGIDSFIQFLRAEHKDWWTVPTMETPYGKSIADTPSGGKHIYLRVPPGTAVPNRLGILPGVDIKGDGGYVVAPPSMLLQHPVLRPGERAGDPVPVPYSWASGCPCHVPEAPGWLLPWIARAPVNGHSLQGNAGQSSPDFEAALEHGIPRGQRNIGLYRLACQRFRVHGTGPDGAVAVLRELHLVLAASDSSDFPAPEVTAIMHSARQFVAGSVEREDREWTRTREMIRWDR